MSLLQMTGISKSFHGVKVLDDVDFSVNQGEVHALLGENGAGKSTLMNILAGVHKRDSGQVFFDGQFLTDTTVRSSERAGIAFVHQELNLFNDLRVYENIYLRREAVHGFGILNKGEMIKTSVSLLEELGIDISPTAYVSELDTSKKQLLEIAKALFLKAKLLILDEPTTSLNNSEIELLFGIIRHLRSMGTSFIFISHKLQEVFQIADRFTVLRNGFLVESGQVANTTVTEVARMMVGSGYTSSDIYQERSLGEEVLQLEDLSGPGFHKVNLSIRRGEIIGFTGLKGAGVSPLMRAIFGASPITSGQLHLFGKAITRHSIHKAMQGRLSMIAANRKENSIIPDFSLLENFYISEHRLSANRPVVLPSKELHKYQTHRDLLDIRAKGAHSPITTLSGGNQQKVILARWLNTKADILLLDNPTQGIDVGSKAEIYRLLQDLAMQGKTILFNTLEIQELQMIADRCVVFFHGSIHTILDREDLTEENVMLAATNAIPSREESA